MDKLFTLRETAKILHVSERSVMRYLKARKLKGSKAGQWRIKESDLENFLEENSKDWLPKEGIVGIKQTNLIGDNLRTIDELSKGLVVAMPNENFLNDYRSSLVLQKSTFEQIHSLTSKFVAESDNINSLVSNIVAPVSAAIAEIGLNTVNAKQLFELGEISKSVFLSSQELSSLSIGTIQSQQVIINSGLQTIKDLKSFNKVLNESMVPSRMIMSGLSETVCAFSTFPHTLDLPSLEIVRDSGAIKKEELVRIQEKLDAWLSDIDPKLVEYRRGCWKTFFDRGPDYIGQASSSIRRLVDVLLEQIAPDEEVIQTNYFKTSPDAKTNKGKPTRRARLYYATDYEQRQSEHLKRLFSWFLNVYGNLPAWDHRPIEDDDFASGIFIATEGHILSLLSEYRKRNN